MSRRYWGRVFPEYGLLPDRAARKAVHRECTRRFRRSGAFRLMLMLVLGFQALLVILNHADAARLWLPWLSRTTRTVVFSLAISISVGIGLNWLWVKPYRRILRNYLNESGVPVCTKCGYGLQGLTEPRCPECGQTFESVQLVENLKRTGEGEKVRK